jgi:two-component system, chemotaxis family, protein-glutamate methylesterase/glutaminase
VRLVAMGASWGGLDAVRQIVRALPPDFPAPVVIAQHRAAESHRTAYRDLIGAATRLRVCEPGDKDALVPGTVYLAPPDYHLLVDGDELGLSVDSPVSFARPSIDVLLESAADAFRDRCVGVVLTGANADGARGLARIAQFGGTAIVQDPETAERDEMPRAALAAVPSARVLPLAEIAPQLVALCSEEAVV